jgi:hypothetical protein
VRAAADPLADDIVSLCDQVGGAAEREAGECRAELRRELPDLVAAFQRRVQ